MFSQDLLGCSVKFTSLKEIIESLFNIQYFWLFQYLSNR